VSFSESSVGNHPPLPVVLRQYPGAAIDEKRPADCQNGQLAEMT